MKRLAIAVPTFNEKENIKNFILAVRDIVIKQKDFDTTLIIIDDNSPDGTGKIIDELASKYDAPPFMISPIHRPEKLGLATAYIQAFKKALKEAYDYILTMDADFSHKPEYIPTFLENIKEYDLVIGSRNVSGGKVENWSPLRNIVSKGGSLYSRIILGMNVKDFTAGFVMYRRRVLESLDLDKIRSRGYSFAIEMKYRIIEKGFSYKEFPIVFPDRKLGKAKMSKKIFFEALLRVWQLRFSRK